MTAEQEATIWMIKNNLHIHNRLNNGEMKELLIDLYVAGKQSVSLEAFEEVIQERVNDIIDDDMLVSYQGLSVENL